jgi:beta-N-acetylhexosaminidase
MLAHSIYPAIDPDDVSTVSKKLITGLLREKMGFNGVITTDSMTMGGLATRYGVPQACAMTLAAGTDLVLMKAQNELVPQTFNAIKQFVEEGKITEEDLDAKLTRIFSMKMEYGLFETDPKQETPTEVVNDTSLTDLARTVAAQSLLTLKDTGNMLPLSREEPFLLVEQETTKRAHLLQHSGMMFKECLAYNPNLAFCETAFGYDEDDKARLDQSIQNYDTVVFTCFYDRADACPAEHINALAMTYPEKNFIVFTNTPFAFSCPENADTIFCTFSVGPESLKAAARLLFGEAEPKGQFPVDYRLPSAG